MITAVDTNVLLDVFGADPTFGSRSRESVRASINLGRIIASDIVWAELTASFPTPDEAQRALERVGVEFSPVGAPAAGAAGAAWRQYRGHGGRRHRLIPDFLIGAHAREHADRLLTRDRGFYRRYFQDLEVVDPSRVTPT